MDVSCKELRKRAWDRLSKDGNYGRSLGVSFLGSLIGSAGLIFTSGAMGYGVANYFVDQQRGRKPPFEDMFSGFSRYGDTLLTGLLMNIFIYFWSLLFLIPGIVKSFAYGLTYYVMRDFDLSGTEAITKSRQLMNGYKGKLFLLQLSFIGWLLLSMLTFGIGTIFLAPYMQAAEAEFYAEVLRENGIEVVIEDGDSGSDL